MKLKLSTLAMLSRFNLRSFSRRETSAPSLTAKTTQLDDDLLHSKSVILSGEFFPTSESVLIERLLKRDVNVQPQMTPETDILICGKYPDWMLVEEARLYGVKIIFIDKAGELFSRLATNLNKSRAFSYEEPLGV